VGKKNWQKSLNFYILNFANPQKKGLMNTEQITALDNEIERLEGSLTGDMFQDMEIRDQIHNLKMQLNGVKPMDSHFDCIGCGS